MKEYIVSPVTVYDDEHQLYGTKVGLKDKNMPLRFTVWGKTEKESKSRAVGLVKYLKNNLVVS